jgi:hypothetical protein
LHYRARRFKEAVPLLEQSLRAEPKSGRAVLNWLWLALACQQQGKPEQARRWLDRAGHGWISSAAGCRGVPSRSRGCTCTTWLEAHVLRREAEALLAAPAAQRK